MLTEIHIKNFKGVQDLRLTELKQINQIVGKNESGKTSIAEAIAFLRSGTARDRHKIREGQTEASIRATFLTDGHKVIASRRLYSDPKKKPGLVLSVDGELRTDASRELLDRFFGVGSFDPLKILEEGERVKAFEGLVDKDWEFPEVVRENFPRHKEFMKKNLDKEEGGPLKKLEILRDALTQLRVWVGREKHDAESLMKEADEDYKNLNMKILDTGIDVSVLPETDELLAEKAKYDATRKSALEIEAALHRSKARMAVVLGKKQAIEDKMNELKVELGKAETESDWASSEIAKYEAQQKQVKNPPNEIYKRIEAGRFRDDAKTKKARLNEKLKTAKEKDSEYSNVNLFLQKGGGFSMLYAPYIQGVGDKVPGLSFEEGEWRYNSRLIKDLSRSQLFALALKIINCKGLKENVVCLDNAECLDADTAKEIGLQEGMNLFLFSVEKKYDLPDSKVIEVKKEKPELGF